MHFAFHPELHFAFQDDYHFIGILQKLGTWTFIMPMSFRTKDCLCNRVIRHRVLGPAHKR